MFEILQPENHGVIDDPYSIPLDKLRAAFDYILSVSDELFEEQVIKKMDDQDDIMDSFVNNGHKDEL